VKIVVGLGNPGQQYAATRHNLGFMVVDELARRFGVNDRRNRFRSELLTIFVGGERVVLVKPQTYMNLSGTAVREVVSWYKADTVSLLVVVDDIDLPFGVTRMRPSGGSGGHNGLKSIIGDLGTDDFARLRLGIGRGRGSVTGQVLTRFNQEESAQLPDLIARGTNCAVGWVEDGVIPAMNRCNQPASPPPSTAEPAVTTPGT
jgi:PTH1 family peptidyl-tRNA hydrolase